MVSNSFYKVIYWFTNKNLIIIFISNGINKNT